ncbi:MAG: 23S rRNA (pseudouridine(1915)-N(3))-methyltransferase RlmH [Sulfuriflexus sp.]|nr:23S rRNA (pseudouridine(1915)-N(3))-methyltransferase RlmH [Sulfuriflexus sp.]
MHIHILAVGQKMPAWVSTGYDEFIKRLPKEFTPLLKEIPPGRRSKNSDLKRAIAEESERILQAIPKDCLVVALDEKGKSWTTRQLAEQMSDWTSSGRDIALIVGGPDGLSTEIKQRADMKWSLSALTLPHALVRVLLAEQLYRAWSLITNHPYHRD